MGTVTAEKFDASQSSVSKINGASEPREMPHNIQLEQGVLGALLLDNAMVERVEQIIKPQHFYASAHARIYEAILKLVERGQTATAATLKSYFEKDEELESVQGAEYLFALAEQAPSILNAPDYANTLRDLHLRRELMRYSDTIQNDASSFDLDKNAQDCLEAAEADLFALAEKGHSQKGFVTLKDAGNIAISLAEKAFLADGNITGATTGLTDVDGKLGGLQNSDLLILAGRPSMGKTALATKIAYEAAAAYAKSGGKEGAPVAFFSLEMSAEQLATRIMSDVANISGDKIRRGAIQQEDFIRFSAAMNELSSIPIYIDDQPGLSIGAVRARARRLKRQHGLGLIIVDYLQLLSGSGSQQSQGNRVLEISEITRGLKGIAKELNIPVLALSQLSRAVENREDKRPQLSDLRESGSIEQDSDVVMFVYRQEYYLSREEPDPGDLEKYTAWEEKLTHARNKAELIVAKQRHGPIGTVSLFFDGNYTRFGDLEYRR